MAAVKRGRFNFRDCTALKLSIGSMRLLVGRTGAARTRLLGDKQSPDRVAPKPIDRWASTGVARITSDFALCRNSKWGPACRDRISDQLPFEPDDASEQEQDDAGYNRRGIPWVQPERAERKDHHDNRGHDPGNHGEPPAQRRLFRDAGDMSAILVRHKASQETPLSKRRCNPDGKGRAKYPQSGAWPSSGKVRSS